MQRRIVYTVAGLVLVNLAIRLAWLCYMHPAQVDDFAWYFSHATQMFNGQGYVWYGHYTSYWPIGYPFFLSVLFHLTSPSVTAGLVANILLSTGIVIAVYGLTRALVTDPRVALCAAVGYTLLPSQLEWNAVLGSEALFTFLLVSSLWLLVRFRFPSLSARGLMPGGAGARSAVGAPFGQTTGFGLVGAGLVMGLAADVRPIVVLFPAVLFVYERFIARQTWRVAWCVAIVFGLAMAIAIAPVTIRNWLTIHHFIVISTNGGVNLWQGTHTNGAYYWSWNPKINPLLPFVQNDYVENQVGMHAAWVFYWHHPLHFVTGGLAKLFFLYWVDWNVVSVTFAQLPTRFSQAAIQFNMWLDTIAYYLWLLVSITGIVQLTRERGTRRGGRLRQARAGAGDFAAHHAATGSPPKLPRHPLIFLPLVYCAYNTAIFFVFPAWDRFRYPMMPLYAVYLGIGAVWLWDKRGRRQRIPDTTGV